LRSTAPKIAFLGLVPRIHLSVSVEAEERAQPIGRDDFGVSMKLNHGSWAQGLGRQEGWKP
jgi:hypothetical protein